MSKKEKITALNVLTAWIFALSICVFAYPIIVATVKPPYVGAATGVIVLTGENTISYLMYKLKVDVYLSWFINASFEKVKKMFSND